jgi:hypothetical protein
MGIVFILIGFSMIFVFLRYWRGGGGILFLTLFVGPCIFTGVAFLIGVVIFKVDEGARKRERAILDTEVEVEKVTKTILEGRKLVGSCMVCKGYLYAGDSIASCPRCKGVAHKGDLLEWIHVKGTCPSCEGHLDEDQVQELQSEGK